MNKKNNYIRTVQKGKKEVLLLSSWFIVNTNNIDHQVLELIHLLQIQNYMYRYDK